MKLAPGFFASVCEDEKRLQSVVSCGLNELCAERPACVEPRSCAACVQVHAAVLVLHSVCATEKLSAPPVGASCRNA